MSKIAILCCALCAFAFASGATAAEGDQLFDRCEKLLGKRLKAPSTYLLVERADMKVRKATKDEYLGSDSPIGRLDESDPQVAEMYAQMGELFDISNFQYASILFTYDAKNLFGVPLRSTSECSVVFSDGQSPDEAPEFTIRVDRLGEIEWILYQQQQR